MARNSMTPEERSEAASEALADATTDQMVEILKKQLGENGMSEFLAERIEKLMNDAELDPVDLLGALGKYTGEKDPDEEYERRRDMEAERS